MVRLSNNDKVTDSKMGLWKNPWLMLHNFYTNFSLHPKQTIHTSLTMERKWKQKRTKKVRQLTERTKARLTVNIVSFKISKYVN